MKVLLTLFIIILLNFNLVNAQDFKFINTQENEHQIHLSLLIEKQLFFNKTFINQDNYLFGISTEIFLKDNLSINYSFAFGYYDSKYHFYLPAGLVSTFAIEKTIINNILDLNFDENENLIQTLISPLVLYSLYLSLIPEGINYYYRVNGYISYCMYFNPFGVHFYGNRAYISSGIGLKLEYPFGDRFLFKPKIGIKELWGNSNKKTLLDIGLNFSIKFK